MNYDFAPLSFAFAIAALAVLALLVALTFFRRRLGKRKLLLQLVLLISIGSLAASAELTQWPSADLIAQQFLSVACYLLLSEWAAYGRKAIGEWTMRVSFGVRWIVIIGGAINLATAPLSHTMGLVMGITMALAAAFASDEWMRLRNWDNARQADIQ